MNLPPHTCTAYIDEVWSFDTTALLVDGDPPTQPITHWHTRGLQAYALEDAPTIEGTDVLQRMRNLEVGSYHLHMTFLTGGNRRDVDMDVEVRG